MKKKSVFTAGKDDCDPYQLEKKIVKTSGLQVEENIKA